MKIKERTPDDLDAAELAAILRGCVATRVPRPTEEQSHLAQQLLRHTIEAAGRGRAAAR